MGVTAVGRTVSSKTVENDDSEIASKVSAYVISPGTITFANGGTGPAVAQSGSKYTVTWGTGVPTSAATVTIPHRLGKTPSKVWLKSTGAAQYKVNTVDGTNIVLGVTNAPGASSVDTFELVVE